jgi:hypothetical protein
MARPKVRKKGKTTKKREGEIMQDTRGYIFLSKEKDIVLMSFGKKTPTTKIYPGSLSAFPFSSQRKIMSSHFIFTFVSMFTTERARFGVFLFVFEITFIF